MKYCFLTAMAMMTLACSKPDPFDGVRELRRQYKLELDFTVSDETGEVTYEIKVQNLSGKTELQEITVLVEALDDQQKPFWDKLVELDVSGLGSYASKSFAHKDAIADTQKLAYFNVSLAPDDKNSNFKDYKEFMRAQ